MSQDSYQEPLYREHEDSALMQLKRDGFEELGSKVEQESGYIYNEENLTVSIQLGEDYKLVNNQQERVVTVESPVWWSTGHVIRVPLQGSSADVKILCGRVTVHGQHGHVLEDHFSQSDLCGYMRRLLGVEKVICNLTPVAQKLGLHEETLNQVVACWQSEAKQLGIILLRWRESQGNTEDPDMLRKALEGLEPEEYTVKERGQMHIKHLREVAVTIVGLQHNNSHTMKYLGHEIKILCNSVLRDCCIEMATPKLDFNLATENYATFLVIHGRISEDVAKEYNDMHWSHEDSITRDIFLVIVPRLIQAVKEIFLDKRIPQAQSGLRGVAEAILDKIASDIQEAAQSKNTSRLFCHVCTILENLCLKNNDNQSSEDKIGSFLRDLHNVALSLLKFAKFDPSQLVRFELNDPTNSSNTQGHSSCLPTQGNDVLKYDESNETFSQMFWICKESEDELQLEAAAHVHINGHICSIGAFETLIILPASCNEAIDRVPIASLSVAVKSEHDMSGNLRVNLYAMQKENVRKALTYLEKELGEDVIDLKQTEIIQSHLRVRSCAEAGTVLSLRLIHKWGSETIVLDSKDCVTLADSTAGGACVPDREIAAEMGRLAIRNELPALPTTSDSTVGNYNSSSSFVMNSSDAELRQRGPVGTSDSSSASTENEERSLSPVETQTSRERPGDRLV
ncbi:hypothetical protein OS493_006438 [Desmophyllum pertusum]|uniref:Uncharacterized protein n=1 Tax=Desmophyllum pertusum TaxID=174260 RepID=A0A9X0A5C9_9CNID|nr:hypothetical protein OS493_006438 [Desmophyllum pertusum]